MSRRRRPSLQLLTELLVRLPHIRIPHVHLPIKMIRQSPVIIKTTEIRAADVADLQFLMSRRPRGV